MCIDWFARIRTHLLRAALYTRAPTSVVRHAQLRLVELAARAAQLCLRAEGGRLTVSEGQLKPLLALLAEAEWTLMLLSDALLELGATQALEGIAIWSRRKLGGVAAAAHRALYS